MPRGRGCLCNKLKSGRWSSINSREAGKLGSRYEVASLIVFQRKLLLEGVKGLFPGAYDVIKRDIVDVDVNEEESQASPTQSDIDPLPPNHTVKSLISSYPDAQIEDILRQELPLCPAQHCTLTERVRSILNWPDYGKSKCSLYEAIIWLDQGDIIIKLIKRLFYFVFNTFHEPNGNLDDMATRIFNHNSRNQPLEQVKRNLQRISRLGLKWSGVVESCNDATGVLFLLGNPSA